MSRHPRFGFLAVIPALLLALPLCSFALPRQMEALDRGLLVSNVGKAGMLVSWRLLGTESSDTEFNLYRDTVKIATIGKTAGTNFLDKDGKPTSKYSVAAVVGGKEGAKQGASVVLDSTVSFDGKSFPYKVLKLDVPVCKTLVTGDTCSYTPNDMSTADLDGDGQYELVVKWDPSNSKDNSQMGKNAYTGPVFIDAYKIDGTKMWRISLGKNIRAGAHYTQFQVYDYDGDGKAEMIVKTGDGTIDGKGKVIGDSSKDYHNDSAMIITGPEYLTVFNGLDGAEITTIDYVPSRDIRKFGPADSTGGTTWGDKYGNRCDRFLAATAYLDGIHPSAIFARGYYTAAYVVAYDFDGKELKQRWFHKSETPGQGLYAQGNHNIAVGDLDGDGFDEIVYGAAALDHDGTVLYSTGYGHGDAGHLTDIDPDHPGLEFWSVHENVNQAPYTDELRGADGKVIWGTMQGGRDNGRGLAADIDSTYRGLELWSSKGGALRSAKGEYIDKPEYYIRDTTDVIYDTVKLADTTMYFTHYIYDEEAFGYPINFRIYFDGDLQDELLDGPVVYKPNVPSGRPLWRLARRADSPFRERPVQGIHPLDSGNYAVPPVHADARLSLPRVGCLAEYRIQPAAPYQLLLAGYGQEACQAHGLHGRQGRLCRGSGCRHHQYFQHRESDGQRIQRDKGYFLQIHVLHRCQGGRPARRCVCQGGYGREDCQDFGQAEQDG